MRNHIDGQNEGGGQSFLNALMEGFGNIHCAYAEIAMFEKLRSKGL